MGVSAQGHGWIANRYELDDSGLAVLDLESPEYSVLTWIAVLLEHRRFKINHMVAREGHRYLIEHFAIDLEPFDMVRGYRADDAYFSYASAFLSNSISIRRLAYAIRLGGLGTQAVVRSRRAYDRLTFLGYEQAPSAICYPKRLARDITARDAFRENVRGFDMSGLYIRDLVAEEVDADDPRLFI